MYSSIIEEYDLNKDDAKSKFEDLIATAASMKEIALCFGVTYKELCDWIVKAYGHPQAEFTYERLKQLALQEYIKILSNLSARGNPSAINALNTYIHKLGGMDQTVKIQFVSNVKEENEEEKKDGD